MLITFMSFLLKFKFWFQFILGARGEHQVMLTHSHDFELFIPICKEVKKIYRDHSYHPKIPLYCIIIPIYITKHLHSIIQEVNELLAKGATEPSSGCAGFYSSMFVVPKHIGGLWPILNLKHFNHYMHIPSFKMPTIKHVWHLIQHGDYAFSIDLQDNYLHIPIVKHHCHFFQFVWHNVPYQWKVLTFGMAIAPQVFNVLTKPMLFLCHHKGICIVIYLDHILVLVHSKWAGKRAHSFLCSLLVRLGLHINFSKSDLCLTQTFCFLGLC